MLKLLTPINPVPTTPTKCGEIFYQNFNNFSMICTFCEMKFFHFDEFQLHVESIHLENYIQEDIETVNEINEIEDVLEDDEEQFIEYNDFDGESSFSDEELMMVLKKPKKKRRIKMPKRSEEDVQDTDNTENTENLVKLEIQLQTSLPEEKEQDSNESSTSNIKKTSKVQEYPCSECPKIYPYRKQLDEHVNEIHNGYKCSQCDNRFRLHHHLLRHELLHTDEKFPCPITNCGKIYKAAEYLKRHLEVHTLPRTFVCDIENCGKSFETQTRLNVHKKGSHFQKLCITKKNYICDICGYICNVRIHLLIHQRTHTGEKPFACEHCEYRGVSKWALMRHSAIHATSRDHVCDVCQAAFVDRRSLKRHKYIHSDERTFQCKLCGKAFKQPHCLGAHVKYVHKEPPKKRNRKKLEILQQLEPKEKNDINNLEIFQQYLNS